MTSKSLDMVDPAQNVHLSYIRVEGPTLVLRLIQPDDADYVFGLRTDPYLNRHLSSVHGTPQDQRRWIEAYKNRERVGREYYFIVERRDGLRCGTVRLYDIGAERFTWGSWILDHNRSKKAALECAVLSFGFSFLTLGRTSAKVDVCGENTHAEAFYRRFGMTEIQRTNDEISFEYTRSRFEADRAGFMDILLGKTTV